MSNIEPYRRQPSSASPMPLSRTWREERAGLQRFVSNEIEHRENLATVQRQDEVNQQRATSAGNLVYRNAQIVDGLAQYREQVFRESGESLRSKDVDDIITKGLEAIGALQARSIQRLG